MNVADGILIVGVTAVSATIPAPVVALARFVMPARAVVMYLVVVF
jgi:hypothetical protein